MRRTVKRRFPYVNRRLIDEAATGAENKAMLDINRWREAFVKNSKALFVADKALRARIVRHFEGQGITRQGVYAWLRTGAIKRDNLTDLANYLGVDVAALRDKVDYRPAGASAVEEDVESLSISIMRYAQLLPEAAQVALLTLLQSITPHGPGGASLSKPYNKSAPRRPKNQGKDDHGADYSP